MSKEKFEWTDELEKEFCIFWNEKYPHFGASHFRDVREAFIKSKEQQPIEPKTGVATYLDGYVMGVNFCRKYGIPESYPLTPEKLYNQSEVDKIREDAFNAGRDRIGGFWNEQIKNWKYQSINDYNSDYFRKSAVMNKKDVVCPPQTANSQQPIDEPTIGEWYKMGERYFSSEQPTAAPPVQPLSKDWEIISFKSDLGYIATKNSAGTYSYPTHGEFLLEGMLRDNTIYSVRRLSDMEVFKVGELVGIKYKDNHSIKSFRIDDEIPTKLLVEFNEPIKGYEDGVVSFQHIQKVNSPQPTNETIVTDNSDKPLFTTEDGVEVCNEHKVFHLVDTDSMELLCKSGTQYLLWEDRPELRGRYKIFSTKEAAEQYILENKPCLSLKEVVELTGHRIMWHDKESLKKAIKMKINPNA